MSAAGKLEFCHCKEVNRLLYVISNSNFEFSERCKAFLRDRHATRCFNARLKVLRKPADCIHVELRIGSLGGFLSASVASTCLLESCLSLVVPAA